MIRFLAGSFCLPKNKTRIYPGSHCLGALNRSFDRCHIGKRGIVGKINGFCLAGGIGHNKTFIRNLGAINEKRVVVVRSIKEHGKSGWTYSCRWVTVEFESAFQVGGIFHGGVAV